MTNIYRDCIERDSLLDLDIDFSVKKSCQMLCILIAEKLYLQNGLFKIRPMVNSSSMFTDIAESRKPPCGNHSCRESSC